MKIGTVCFQGQMELSPGQAGQEEGDLQPKLSPACSGMALAGQRYREGDGLRPTQGGREAGPAMHRPGRWRPGMGVSVAIV